ncbi:MAG: hypothetical protein WCJ37_02720 [Syntrophus sp. (in: bacteria)]
MPKYNSRVKIFEWFLDIIFICVTLYTFFITGYIGEIRGYFFWTYGIIGGFVAFVVMSIIMGFAWVFLAINHNLKTLIELHQSNNQRNKRQDDYDDDDDLEAIHRSEEVIIIDNDAKKRRINVLITFCIVALVILIVVIFFRK